MITCFRTDTKDKKKRYTKSAAKTQILKEKTTSYNVLSIKERPTIKGNNKIPTILLVVNTIKI